MTRLAVLHGNCDTPWWHRLARQFSGTTIRAFNGVSHEVPEDGTLDNDVVEQIARHEAWGGDASDAQRSDIRRWCTLFGGLLAGVDTLIVWNGRTMMLASAVYVAQRMGVRVVYTERGLLPNTMQIDVRGINDRSSLAVMPRYPDADGDLVRTIQRRLPFPQRQANTLLTVADDTLPVSHLLFLAQVTGDSQLTSCDSPFVDPVDAAVAADAAAQTLGLPFVCRLHPNDLPRWREYRERTHGSLVHRLPLADCLDKSAVVVTVNSSAGYEARVRGIPVVAMGRAVYHHCVGAWDVRHDALASAVSRAMDEAMREQFGEFSTELYYHSVPAEHANIVRRVTLLENGLLDELRPLAEQKVAL